MFYHLWAWLKVTSFALIKRVSPYWSFYALETGSASGTNKIWSSSKDEAMRDWACWLYREMISVVPFIDTKFCIIVSIEFHNSTQCSVNIIIYIFIICERYFYKTKGNTVWLFSREICQGTIAKRKASLQLSIVKILARASSRHWNFSMCGYKGITLVTCSIVWVQCLSEFFSVPIDR